MPVERPTFHESWYRVSDLHPRVRSTVQISRQHFRGLPWFVIQDHTNNVFFRLAEPAYRFIGLLDGVRTVGRAWNLASEQLGDDAPTQGEVIQLLGQLYTANLLQAEVPADTHTLFARYKKRKQREISGYFMQIMFARIPIFDPDAFLNKWLPLLGWIFSPLGLALWMLLFGIGIYDISQVHDWQNKLRSPAQGLLDPNNLILLYVAFAMIKACHEFGHAIACKKFGRQSGTGGEVHIIGIMFLVFTPVPYVDASSSWALTNKWHRIIVGAAGMWVELAIASIAAMVWASSSDGMAHSFAYNVMFVAGFSTLVFNANPLLRYDGYYMLSDLLEVPNMATRSRDYVYYLVKKYLWNVRFARNPAHTASEKVLLFLYAVASFIMRIFVTVSIMFYLTGVLEGALIIIATVMALAGLLTWALVPIVKFIHFVTTSQELQRERVRAMLTSAVGLGILVALIGFISLPDRARAQGVVEAASGLLKEVYADGEGSIIELHDQPNEGRHLDPLADRLAMPYIRKGDALVTTENKLLELQLKQAQAERDKLTLELNKARVEAPDSVPGLEVQKADSEARIASINSRLSDLTFHSPISGVLIAPGLEKKHFAFVKRSEPLGVIADLHDLILRVAVTQDLFSRLEQEGQAHPHVEIRVQGRPDILLTGEISKDPPSGQTDMFSPALSLQAGGPLTPAADDQKGAKSSESFFEVQINNLQLQSAPQRTMTQLKQSGGLPLLPGQRVVVRFELKPKPIAQQAWIKLLQVFQRKFNLS